MPSFGQPGPSKGYSLGVDHAEMLMQAVTVLVLVLVLVELRRNGRR